MRLIYLALQLIFKTFIVFNSIWLVPLWMYSIHFYPTFCSKKLYFGIASPGPQHSQVPVEFGQWEAPAANQKQVEREIGVLLWWVPSTVGHYLPETVPLYCWLQLLFYNFSPEQGENHFFPWLLPLASLSFQVIVHQ